MTADSDRLERERWERMRGVHERNEMLRALEEEKGTKLRDDDGTAARLRTVFGRDGSPDNAWWTTWRPEA